MSVTKGQTLSHYRLVEKIGEGGMGVVWRAEDTVLNRTVAIKVLPADVALDEERRQMFLDEARLAASVSHARIVQVHELGREGDLDFIVMEYVDGQPLSRILQHRPLPPDKVADWGLQVAQGLARAHRQGLIHRDLKPANILVTSEDDLKIVDFGLATLFSKSDTATGSLAPTRSEAAAGQAATAISGTLPYMSPEQVRGEELDTRSDIFSFGSVLYEMTTGQRPFAGARPADVAQEILKSQPTPVHKLVPKIPLDLHRMIEKALSQRAADRYQHVDDLAVDLKRLARELESGSSPSYQDLNEETGPSIAVLPFANMSADEDQEYFCEGLAEEIINALTKIQGLRVASRMSAFQFDATAGDSREIGQKLGVRSLLEGSVRKAGDRLRITAQLINVADGYHLWSERYDRELKDVFAIQDEIAQAIARALQVMLSEKEKRAISKAPTANVQAYDYYLRGRSFFYRVQRTGMEIAREMFSRAIGCDPNYALAYAGIADCCSWLFMYFDSNRVNLEQALDASRNALELDSELAEAHAARALAMMLQEQYEEAEREFEEAVRLNPRLYEAYYFYARACFVQGRFEKAVQLFEEACRVNPADYQSRFLLANALEGLGDIPRALAAYREGLRLAEQRLELNPDDVRALYFGAHGLVRLGDPEKGRKWVGRALSLDPGPPGMDSQ